MLAGHGKETANGRMAAALKVNDYKSFQYWRRLYD
jgi:hypothetical protein